MGARWESATFSRFALQSATAIRKTDESSAGNRPAVNIAAIETPVTEPMMISTRLGGIVSAIAPDVASSAIIELRFCPRFSMSGNSTGATAAMSAIFEPDMPETRYIAATSTIDRPPRTCPTRLASASTSRRAMPAVSIKSPRKTKSGTASSTILETPSSMRPTTVLSGTFCRDREIAQRPDAERKRDRDADRDARADEEDEKDHEVDVAELGEQRRVRSSATALSTTAPATTIATTLGSLSLRRSNASTRISASPKMTASTTYDCGMLRRG